jgi:GNAT superfamily N-acetyltransferase
MTRPDLVRRIDEAGLNAWPAVRTVLYDGWLLRFGYGHTRRVNSINVIGPGVIDLETKLAYCEAVYRGWGLPPIFRFILNREPDLQDALDRRGYELAEDETVLMHSVLDLDIQATPDLAITLEPRPGEAWLGAIARLQGQDTANASAYRAIVAGLAIPARFAMLHDAAGQPVAIGYGAVHDGMLCINSVVTDPAARRQGLSRRLLGQLIAWASHDAGATGACLAVVAANAPAIALYTGFGFSEVARYDYRRRADAP